MAKKTTNYNLHKIDLTDAPPDITVLNPNFDTIDTELKKTTDVANSAWYNLDNHKKAKDNPHSVTKAQVGLGSVDDTSDLNKPLSTAAQTALDTKVDKVAGKQLSTNDYTTAEKNKLDGIQSGATNYVHPPTHPPSIIEQDVSNRFMTDAERTKLAAIQAGAQVNTVTGVKGNSESTYRTGNINLTALNLGLGSVDNTSDASKPISTATQTALNNKADKNLSNVSNADFLRKASGAGVGGGKKYARIVIGTSKQEYASGTGYTSSDCDYFCDGIKDDVEINAAIDATKGTGIVEILLLGGTYSLSKTVILDSGELAFKGIGVGTTIRGLASPLLIASNGTVKDLMLKGGEIGTNSTYYNTNLMTMYDGTISGVTFSSCQLALTLTGSCKIFNNYFINCQESILLNGSQSIISSNHFDGGVVAITTGSSSHNNIISNNLCETVNQSDYEIERGAFTIYGEEHLITGNMFYWYYIAGIQLIATKKISVIGNYLSTTPSSNGRKTIHLKGTNNMDALIAENMLFGKNYTSEGGTGNTFYNNKYQSS